MKFAKELEQDLVPEWRVKYLDYKIGKKKVKAVSRAVNRTNATPRTPAQPNIHPQRQSIYGSTSPFTPRNRPPSTLRRFDGANDESHEPIRKSPAPLAADSPKSSSEDPANPPMKTPPMHIPEPKRSPKAPEPSGAYGSFVPTPPKHTRSTPFELPDPAVSPQTPVREGVPQSLAVPGQNSGPSSNGGPLAPRSASVSGPQSAHQSAYEVGNTITPPHRTATFATLRNRLPQGGQIRPLMRRVFSVGTPLTPSESRRLDVDMVAVDHVKSKQKEFFAWMDDELEKVETFYKSKEDEAGLRLEVLREQLHKMRNLRIQEIAEAQHAKALRKEEERAIFDFHGRRSIDQSKKDDDSCRPNSRDKLHAWFQPVDRMIGHAKARALGPRIGSNSKSLQSMHATPELRHNLPGNQHQRADDHRDYVRQPVSNVPYRTAKRKLKLALQEFYRGLELLKSYALLNRTAFRKINKKYDKAIDAHPPLRYMSEKVNKAYFVNSDLSDKYMHDVEDLYARYFERGNHKIATGKLRSSQGRKADQSGNAFRNGLLIGVGAVFSVQGVIYGAELLQHADPTIRTQTSYLLQIYGGYFLALYLFAWFCLDCSIWTHNKINYAFVFEFDPRHNLDWRQLSEFPSFLLFLLGLFVWINFSRYGTPAMFIYYPVILIFATACIIFFPGPLFFHRSRRWFVYSHWRLLLAGLYPVEFRDFFLGDMYCSLTYYMSNIELFFCLYAHHWSNPSQCNSTHSRLLGFFSTIPGIWRALQCVRRFYDTRNVFPHLVNCGKYMMTIMYYISLSIYRIDRSKSNLALFSTFAAINALYCSIWDLFMDWSLLQPNANKRLLRDVRGYRNPNYYYLAMILDPILRCNWIFYSIYVADLQHSSIVSFLVGFSEVTRRGMWTLLRVENEHCSNVARFKASRDIPLPYEIETPSQEFLHQGQTPRLQTAATTQATSPTISRHRSRTSALEAQDGATEGMRKRAGTRTFTSILANAHTQDFEKKRKPGVGDSDSVTTLKRGGSFDVGEDGRAGSSDDEDDEDDNDEQDTQDIVDAEALLRQRNRREGEERE